MIFVAGIHGVGKTIFCKEMENKLEARTYSGSKLITQKGNQEFPQNKHIIGIENNQSVLLAAVADINKKDDFYLLDGHFCLLNSFNQVTRIELSVFAALAPQAIILLTESPETIISRRENRDNIEINREETEHFQNEEILYATEVAKYLDIPLFVSRGIGDTTEALHFISRFIHINPI